MPLESKRLAGITALIASLLLGSYGTGAEGELFRAPPTVPGEGAQAVVQSCFVRRGTPHGYYSALRYHSAAWANNGGFIDCLAG